jgi:hypothetical protein
MSKNPTVMKAKMWMLSVFAVIVILVATCHTAFAYDDQGISANEILLRQSYIDSNNHALDNKEKDELAEEGAYKLVVFSNCAVYRIMQAQAADNIPLREHRMKQGNKLLNHFVMYAMSLEDVLGVETIDADLKSEEVEREASVISNSLRVLFANDLSKELVERKRNMDNVCMDIDSLVEGREWNVLPR